MSSFATTVPVPAVGARPQTGIVRNTFNLAMGQAATTVLTVLLSAAIARTLGPTDFGLLYFVTSAATFAYVFVDWGHGIYIVREVARHPEKTGELMGTVMVVRLATAVALCGPTVLIAWLLGYDGRTQLLIVALMTAWVPMYLGLSYGWAFRGRERMEFDALISVILKFLTLVLATIFLSLGGRLLSVIAAIGISGVATFVAGAAIYRHLGLKTLKFSLPMARELAVCGAPMMTMTVAVAVQPYIDANMLSRFSSHAVLGWYGAAATFSGTLVAPAFILASAAYPRLSVAAGHPTEFRQILQDALRPLLFIAVLGAVGTYLFAPFAVGIVYSVDKFGPSVSILRAFSPALILIFMDMMFGTAILAAGRAVHLASAKLLAVVVMTSLEFVLIPYFQSHWSNGGIAVMLSMGGGELVMVAAALYLLPRGTFGWSMGTAFLRAAAAGGGTLLVMLALPHLTPFVGIPACILLFGLLSLLVGLITTADLRNLTTILRRKELQSTVPVSVTTNRASSMNVPSAISRKPKIRLSALVSKAARRARESVAAGWFLRGCTRVGRGARAIGSPLVRNGGRIVIGKRFQVTSRWNPVELTTREGATIEIGDDVAINYGTLISARSRVTIGDRAQIGNLCIIADTQLPNLPGDMSDGSPIDEPEPIEIGADVWLAVRVTVMPGARIGQGAVITAGSTVSGAIPARVVAGGNPARVIRTLDIADTPATEAPRPTASVAVALPPPEPAVVEFRGIVTADFTADELSHLLQAGVDRPIVEARIAPFNQVTQSLLGGGSPGASDFAVVWTRPEAVAPSFQRLIEAHIASPADALAEVDAFCDLLAKAAQDYRFVFVPTWTMPHWHRGLGLLDARSGIIRVLTAMNLRLMERLDTIPNAHALNAQRWIESAERSAYTPKPWYLGKLMFPTEVMAEAARDVKAALGALTGLARKVVVVDLDDTLWGGTVGELGWRNLRLGGHDPHGEAFVDFQAALKALTRRGVILAIASKNEESVALEAIASHPEMMLRQSDFVAWRINWSDKAQNIADLAAELNLGLQSFVFLDNDAVERARVREALPEVLVPDWPEDPLLYRNALHGLRCFDTPAVTQSDLNRTGLYAAERERERFKTQVGSVEEWLTSLNMRVLVEELSPTNVTRVAQLFNKTNQMNLSTRRLAAEELLAWTADPRRSLWALTVSDRFGDAGLTGVISLEAEDGHGRIVDFILSCRVMGRKVENAMVHLAVERARKLGLGAVEAQYTPTSKNKPCFDFWQRSGFSAEENGRFVWAADREYLLPTEIHLEREA
jgi:FkbH-like protein